MKSFPPFLASEIKNSPKEEAFFHIYSCPLEETVSFGGGTALGPEAILEASSQLEVWDGYSNPSALGISTQPPIDTAGPVEEVLQSLSEAIESTLEQGAVPVLLGGEHTVSVGAFLALARRPERIGIVQVDAHGDLRDTYEGSPFSHACALRRGVDLGLDLFQIGVRSISPDEVEFRKEKGIPHLDARELHRQSPLALELPDSFPSQVYLTVDIDGLDPSLFPDTGTPEPGGLFYPQFIQLIEELAQERQIIGFDLVELAPPQGDLRTAFLAARLVYDVMGIIQRSQRRSGN